MKAKMSTKMLCFVLCLVMLVTSVPVAAITAHTAHAQEDERAASATVLKTAIKDYEVKMDGTIYENMGAAYTAYCNAMKLYDRYYYGSDSEVTKENLDDAANELKSTTDAMTSHTFSTDAWEVAPQESDDGSGNKTDAYSTNAVPFYNNILYITVLPAKSEIYGKTDGIIEEGKSVVSGYGTTLEEGLELGIVHSTAVVVYDGGEAPVIPVIAIQSYKSDEYNKPTVYSVYPTMGENSIRESSEISLGYLEGLSGNMTYTKSDGGQDGADVSVFYNKFSGKNGYWLSNTGLWCFNFTQSIIALSYGWWGADQFVAGNYENGVVGMQHEDIVSARNTLLNGIQVNSMGSNEYTRTINPTWYFSAGAEANTDYGFINSDKDKIYVINYKALMDAVSRNSQKLDISATNTYAGGQLKAVIDVFDKAMSLDISNSGDYNYAENPQNAVEKAGSAIQTLVKELDSASATADPAVYATLRDAIDKQRDRYENTDEASKALYENWSDFENAYNDVRKIMKDASNPADKEKYYPADDESGSKKQAAEKLSAFLLEAKTARVDTIVLENTINNAQYVVNNRSFFDVDDTKIDAIKSAIKTAKDTIWGGEKHYPLDQYKPADDDTSFNNVYNQTTAVAGTIRNIKLNLDAKVDYADNYSLNTVMSKAQEYIGDAEKYANTDDVQIAYNNADAFKNGTNNSIKQPGTAYYVRDLVNKYKELVLSVFDSFNSLKEAFTTKITDGQIISDGGENTIKINTTYTNPSNESADYTVTYTRSNDHIIFRKSADEGTFELGNARIVYSNTVTDIGANQDNGLDSININLDPTTSWETQTFAAQNNWDERMYRANGTGYPGMPGNLTANATDGASFSITDNHVLSGGVSVDDQTIHYALISAANSDKSDEWLTSSQTEISNLLEKTDATSSNWKSVGSVYSFGTPTVIRGKLNVTIPKNSSYNQEDLKDAEKNTAIQVGQKTYSLNNKSFGVSLFCDSTSVSGAQSNILFEKQPYNQSVTVIDITPLTDLVNLADERIKDSTNFTDESIKELSAVRTKADEPFAYWNLGANEIAELLQERYDALCIAYNNCKERADFYNQQVTYTDSDGNTKTEIMSYNDAKYTLYKALEQKRITKSTLERIQAMLDDPAQFVYINLSDQERINVSAEVQEAIKEEMELFLELAYKGTKNGEKVVEVADLSAYEAKTSEVSSLNTDAYDISAIKSFVEKQTVQIFTSINGEPITVYKDQGDIDNVIQSIADEEIKNQYPYTVTLTDQSTGKNYYIAKAGDSYTLKEGYIADDAKTFNYGELVKVTMSGGNNYDWFASVTAKTTNLKQQSHLMVSGVNSYEFNVRGNTELAISESDGNSGTFAKITFINNSVVKNAIGYAYVKKGTDYNLSEAPVQKRMFYQIDKYYVMEDGVKTETHYDPSDTPTFTKDTTLLVTYKPIESEKTGDYQIITYRHDNDNQFASQDVKYNQLTTVDYADPSNDNKVQQLIDKNTGKILSYTNSYTFYACDDLTVKPIVRTTQDTYVDTDGDSNFDVSVISKPVLSNQRAQFVGSFAKPSSSSATIIGAGVVLDASSSPATDKLTLGDVDGANNILNLSVPVSSIMKNTNQFAVSIGYAGFSNKNISYVSYVTYETVVDGKKISQTVYSNIVTNAELN